MGKRTRDSSTKSSDENPKLKEQSFIIIEEDYKCNELKRQIKRYKVTKTNEKLDELGE